ncbi:MAG: uS2 family ribosomal protein, partial [Holophagales bacterium]|nr:uS2 family ribosomal protein [Holophagales bacterium]
CDPETVDYVIPGTDAAIRTIRLFSAKIADAFLGGAGELAEKRMIEAKDEAPEAAERAEETAAGITEAVATKAPAETPAAEAPAETPAAEAPAETPAAEAPAEAAAEAEDGGTRQAADTTGANDEPTEAEARDGEPEKAESEKE